MKGPRLQRDIFDIMLRFRVNKIAFTADIEKIYLHVRLNEKDQNMQRILLRTKPNGPIDEYVLMTAKFGISCPPFLSVAAIQNHAKRSMDEHPRACKIILEDSYMDDISSCCDALEEAVELQRNITDILAEANFPLRKWVSNSGELMQRIPGSEKGGFEERTGNACGKYVSTLGLVWFYECDKMGLKATITANSGIIKIKNCSC